MGKNTSIEWCNHTFNPWLGCTKVSPGCANCYAETLMDTRYGRVKWGKGNERSRTSAGNWNEPKRWNRDAEKAGVRQRVFCASLADVFDDEVKNEWRDDLWKIIEATPWLDWLLLTKRTDVMLSETRRLGLPKNVWLGVSVENQKCADERIPTLIETDADIKFLSVEPMLGEIDLSYWLTEPILPNLQWVIVGGESGPGSRPMQESWVQQIRAECEAANVPFFFKQWGGKLNKTLGVDKHATGRMLNNRTYDALPTERVNHLLGGWVKIKTRLPKAPAAYPVITFAFPGVWTAGIFDKETGVWTDAMTKRELDIKLWYPLPNPNKGGKSS